MSRAILFLSTSLALLLGGIATSCEEETLQPGVERSVVYDDIDRQGRVDVEQASDRALPPRVAQGPSRDQGPKAGPMHHQLQAGCPLLLEGAQVETRDTDEGVTLTFTTTNEGDVEELRRRVEHLAWMYEHHRGHTHMSWHRRGGQAAGRGLGPPPATDTRVVELDRGARIYLRPVDPAHLGALRQRVQQHAQRMGAGECWMLRR